MELLKANEIPIDIMEAYEFARISHKGQFRKFTNEPYIKHPEQVVCILAMYTGDTDLLTAAMLHDVVEDTSATIYDIYELFGDRVGELVRELTTDLREKKLLGKKIYMANHVNVLSDDAFTIKLADRLHNVLGLLHPSMPKDFTLWYWKETNYILDNLDRNNYSNIQKKLLDILEFFTDYVEIVKT